MMKLGIWTPVPHAIAPEPRLTAAIRQAEAPADLPYHDEAFAFAREVACRGDELGFDITLIAERWVGTVRRDCLDWLLILGRRHLEQVSKKCIAPYNAARPHRALGLGAPGATRPATGSSPGGRPSRPAGSGSSSWMSLPA